MTKLSTKNSKILGIVAYCIVLAVIILLVIFQVQRVDVSNFSNTDTNVTDEELAEYRKNIGNSMDVKKSVLIIFNTVEECKTFIEEYGPKEDLLSLGKGIVPQLQGENGEQYYNVVGNTTFEQLFDSMKDGEYLKTPVEFGGAYCYFKRLENYSILNNDKDLKAFIASEKSIEKGGKIE